jgi:hypothetical protein
MPGGNRNPPKRGRVTGWTQSAARRHVRWLWSVNAPELAGDGFAITLTLRDLPPDAQTFHAMRRAWEKRLKRMGVTRIHWVIEWQRRGVPHLHCAVYFGPDAPAAIVENVHGFMAVAAWLDLAEDYGATMQGQDVKPIAGELGWMEYLSKHASRGVHHYQRQGKPPGWETTGRLWGHSGDWPADEPMRFEMDRAAFYRYRRQVRAYRVAQAVTEGDPMHIRYARKMLACPDPKVSGFRGVGEWVDESVTLTLMGWLADEGHSVEQAI